MFSALLRVSAFLFAFFIFFGPQAVAFAAENPSRVELRLEALSPAAGVKTFAPPGHARVEAVAARQSRALDYVTLQISKMKFATVLFTPEARADEPSIGPAQPEIDLSAIAALFGKGGASALAIAAAVTQLLLFIAKKLWNPSGGWQLTLVLVLSVGSTLLSGMTVGGMTFAAALASAPVVAALQVLLNQIVKKAVAA